MRFLSRIVTIAFILSVSEISAQEPEFPLEDFVGEGVQNIIHGTELVIEDPIFASWRIPFADEIINFQKKTNKPVYYSNISAVWFNTRNTKALLIPMGIKYQDFSFQLTIPYVFNRRIKYSNYHANARGIGDIGLSINRSFVSSDKVFTATGLIKIPTGNTDVIDQYNGTGYPVPLGNGSLDFGFGIGAEIPVNIPKMGRLFLSNKIHYLFRSPKIWSVQNNGFNTEIEARNGNTLWYNIAAMKRISKRIQFYIAANFLVNNGGNSSWNIEQEDGSATNGSDASNFQEMKLLDISPKIVYLNNKYHLSLLLDLPVLTQRHENNTEPDRYPILRFGVTIPVHLSKVKP
ncbi:MAG: hypothetical protein P9L92_07105 [Candidatus Electryonea clarkiae]|nr:hypothetical protein [Candidatus Electryonea clarkiae]MDP8286493.1 hypothetical protein [Candidatus Electryonea clarkiae]